MDRPLVLLLSDNREDVELYSLALVTEGFQVKVGPKLTERDLPDLSGASVVMLSVSLRESHR